MDKFTLCTKPLNMSSLQIAELTGKRHDHVMRDIREMFKALNIVPNFGGIYKDIRGRERKYFDLDEELTLTLTSGYSIVQRNAIIKQWNYMRKSLEVLRYRKHDTKAQIEAMAVIGNYLPQEEPKQNLPYIKANIVVNKIVSDLFGFPKLLKKDQMSLPMLESRSKILGTYVTLFDLGFSNHRVNELLREKYFTGVAA